MQRFARNLTTLSLLFTAGQAAADVFYSGLRNISIPTTYQGINIDVDGVGGWDLNPFMGGVYLYNNTAFQPVRDGTGGLGTVLNFTAGNEGYLGFKLNGTDYGWMRVIFTNNNTGALIKDWGYNTGGSIATGNVIQSGSTYTVDSSVQSFALGSAITGSNSLVKNGLNTVTLNANNTYTGATTVSNGTLIITGSTSSTSLVSVSSGATLGCTGTVGGATTISGTHNPGNSPGIQTFGSNLAYTGGASVVNWELTGNTSSNAANPNAIFDQIIVGGDLDFTDLTTLNLIFNASSTAVWTNTFWDISQSWTLSDVAGTTSNFANLSLTIINWLDSGGNPFSTIGGSFSLSQSGNDVILNYVIPEPNVAALIGGSECSFCFAAVAEAVGTVGPAFSSCHCPLHFRKPTLG